MVRLLAEVDSSDECEHERPWRTYCLPPVSEFFSTLQSPLVLLNLLMSLFVNLDVFILYR